MNGKLVGTWVWMPHETEVHVMAKVVSTDGPIRVQTEDGAMHVLSADVEAADEQARDASIDNLIVLNDLNERSILHNLRIRFKQNTIYTNVSSILISVNPFKLLPLYTPEIMELYREGSRGKPPHVFGVAINAYTAMMSERKNQSVIISGESGAGKSEATKLILQFIAEVSSRRNGASIGKLEQQLLDANPILEAMGNAKTVRNNNSSRFGKLVSVKFDAAGLIVAGVVVDYLLEKSRVAYQARGERNYHVFYELVAGCAADRELRAVLALDDPTDYYFLNRSGVTTLEGRADDTEFDTMLRSMTSLDFAQTERDSIFKVIAAILHLSNVQFEVETRSIEEDASRVANMATLEMAAALIGLDADALKRALTTRNVGSRSVILVSYNVAQATAARDAMCKAIYGASPIARCSRCIRRRWLVQVDHRQDQQIP